MQCGTMDDENYHEMGGVPIGHCGFFNLPHFLSLVVPHMHACYTHFGACCRRV